MKPARPIGPIRKTVPGWLCFFLGGFVGVLLHHVAMVIR